MTVPVKATRKKWKPTPAMRRAMVSLLARKGMSNRAIANEVKSDEATIRRDLKFLHTPEDQRPVKIPRPKKVRRLTREQRLKQMLKIFQKWVADQAMERAYVLWIIPEANKRLFKAREYISTIPESPLSLAERLHAMKPREPKEHFTSDMLEFWTAWLVNWLALCAPRDEALRDEVLSKTQQWAEVSLPY